MAKTINIYRVAKQNEQEGSVARVTGSGRRAIKMTREKMAQIRRLVDHKTGFSQRSLAVRFDCTQGFAVLDIAKPCLTVSTSDLRVN